MGQFKAKSIENKADSIVKKAKLQSLQYFRRAHISHSPSNSIYMRNMRKSGSVT